jgi:hypothetical protein
MTSDEPIRDGLIHQVEVRRKMPLVRIVKDEPNWRKQVMAEFMRQVHKDARGDK